VAERLRPLLRWESGLVLLLIGTIIYGNNASQYFFTSGNVFYILLNVGEVAIMALPLTLIVITGEIDLSVASILGLSGLVMGELFMHGYGLWWAMAGALVVGAIAGAFNGLLITRLGLPSLAVTIGTLTLYRGIAQGILPTDTIQVSKSPYSDIGVVPIRGTEIPWSFAFFAVLAVIFGIVLHATPLGRRIYAIGAGQEAARFAGIRVRRIKFWLYVLSGLLCGLAGVLWTLRFSSARYDSGTGLELFVVTAVLLGGVSIFGGRGTMVGVVLAVVVLGCLQTAMTQALVRPGIQNIVVGTLLILSVVIPNLPGIYQRARMRLRSMSARRHAGEAAEAAEA
jgi:rhamnose transport system permease protein